MFRTKSAVPKWFPRIFGALCLIINSTLAFAQQKEPSAVPGLAACGGCLSIWIILVVALIAMGIAILVWVQKDAKNRGMDNPILWMILVFFTSWLGLLIYVLSRPKGKLVQCPNCKGKRLEVLNKCPHCGHE